MGIWMVCQICKDTVDFDRLKDRSDNFICNKCFDKIPDYVSSSQHYAWLKMDKFNKTKRK